MYGIRVSYRVCLLDIKHLLTDEYDIAGSIVSI